MNAETAAQGKVALITGASRGIGLAIARSLASLGAKVAICARFQKTRSCGGRPEASGRKRRRDSRGRS